MSAEKGQDPAETVRVVAICGSLRDGSTTQKGLKIALRGAAAIGAETELIDLRDRDLPFCKEVDAEDSEAIQRLRKDVASAQGIIWGTPEYHGGYSGVLKNALDLMGFDEFEGKVVGLLGVSGGRMGGLNALMNLREVARAVHAWAIPTQAGIPHASQAFDEDGELKDDKLRERVESMGRDVARFARLHHARRTEEFLVEWEKAQENPGGEDR